MYTTNLTHDIASNNSYMSKEDIEQFEPCHFDGDYYPVNEMIKLEWYYVAIKNINPYLIWIENEMCQEDFIEHVNEIEKILNNIK